MENKYYWLASFLEKWPDGTVKGYKTAIHCETLAWAAQIVGVELHIREKANGTECVLYSIGIADNDVADLTGKTEVDNLSIDWPE